jgi:hypothetical protein
MPQAEQFQVEGIRLQFGEFECADGGELPIPLSKSLVSAGAALALGAVLN